MTQHTEYEPTIVDTEAYKNSPFNVKNDKPVNIITGELVYHYEAKTGTRSTKNRTSKSRLSFENPAKKQFVPENMNENLQSNKSDSSLYKKDNSKPAPDTYRRPFRQNHGNQEYEETKSNKPHQWNNPSYHRKSKTYDQHKQPFKSSYQKPTTDKYNQSQASRYHPGKNYGYKKHQLAEQTGATGSEEYYEILGTEDLTNPRRNKKHFLTDSKLNKN